MSNSSAEQVYSITLNDVDSYGFAAQDISTMIASDTITLTSGTSGSYFYNTGAGMGGAGSTSFTIANGGISSIGSVTLDSTHFNWGDTEWVNAFPQWARIQEMCEQYPGLKIAFEKFKTTYKLVKDDYDNPKDKK